MTLPYTSLPNVSMLMGSSAPRELERVSDATRLSPNLERELRRRWTEVGHTPPDSIPSNFDKMFLVMKTLSPHFCVEGRSLVDFGCGLSVFLAQAANLNMSCLGIDTFEEYGGHCEEMAHIACATISTGVRRPRLVRADLVQSDVIPNNAFDFATSMGMMEHVYGRDNRDKIVRQMMRSLRPGGWLLLLCGPNRRFPIDLFHYGPRFPLLHSLPVEARRVYLKLLAGARNKDPHWLTGMSVSELEHSMCISGADAVYQLFPLWVQLARADLAMGLRSVAVCFASVMSRMKAEPIIVLAAQKGPV